MRYCGQCGSPNLEASRFCTNCGAKLRDFEAESANAASDNVTANDNVTSTSETATFETAASATSTADSTSTYAHPQYQEAQVYSATQQAPVNPTPQQTSSAEPAKSTSSGDISALSIIAFIFAFIPPLTIASLIMGIIDLCMTDGRKKGLSIAAVVISALATVVFVVAVVLPMTFILGVL